MKQTEIYLLFGIITIILCIDAVIMHIDAQHNAQLKQDLIQLIEQNSVHPIYGNYKKRDAKGNTCSPWDSCK